jgi:crotonobetainyl-CoA:carnitine CoA-transferase CaiB-like acyl-CoA transferase
MPGVFDGVRVLDLSWGIAGPMTTMLLADNGAAVTRIERPAGDPFAGQTGYRVWNRGKRRASLDLRAGDGRDAFLSLADAADLVVESFSPGTTAALGIDHATLSARNPSLITCSITGYGRGNRHSGRPGYDALVAARTGLLFDQKGRRGGAMEFIAGRPGPHPDFDGPEGMVRGADRPGPVMPRSPWPSIGATYLGALGIAAALRAREHTGRGQWVETSLLQGALAAVCLNWQRVEDPDAPLYWMWPVDGRAIEGLFECADRRWVHHWTVRPHWALTAAEGDELRPHPLETAYRDDPDRISMDPEGFLSGIFLQPLLVEAFRKFPSADWVAAGEEAGMGVALVRSPGEALMDESFLADGCVAEVDDPEVGPIRHVGTLLEFSATPGAMGGPTVPAGRDTAEVLAEAAGAAAAPRPARAAGRDLAGPLAGVRVLDLGLGVAGPFTGRMLADLGADVVKVNALHDGYWCGTHMGLGTNRGKRSIAVDLKHPRGREVLDRLIERADVVTTNWRPGAAARLDLNFETLHARYPRLVFCNTRGFEKGPRSKLPGTDQTAAALTGTEWTDGACDAGNPPLWSRSNMGDTGNALLAAIAITSALYHRDRTGEGQEVSTSIVNAGLLHTSYAWVHADGSPSDWGQVDGQQYGLGRSYRLYACADDTWLFVAAITPEQQAALDALGDDLEATFSTRPAGEWSAELDRSGVPVEVVDETFCRTMFDDPELRAASMISETRSASVGRFEDPGLLFRFSDTPAVVQRGPSQCGEHTRELLAEHGYSSDEIDSLAADHAVLDARADQPVV